MDRDQIRSATKTVWTLIVVRAVLMIILGALFLFKTAPAIAGFILYLGVFWLIDGLITSFQSIRFRSMLPNWGWALFSGILSVVAGIFLISKPALGTVVTTTTFVYVISILMVIAAISMIMAGIKLRKQIDHEWALIFSGLAWLALAVVFMNNPLVTTVVLAKILGSISLIFGIFILYRAIQAKKNLGQLQERLHHQLKDW